MSGMAKEIGSEAESKGPLVAGAGGLAMGAAAWVGDGVAPVGPDAVGAEVLGAAVDAAAGGATVVVPAETWPVEVAF